MKPGEDVVVENRDEPAGAATQAHGRHQELRFLGEVEPVEREITARIELPHGRETDRRSHERDDGLAGRTERTAHDAAERLGVFLTEVRHDGRAAQDFRQFVVRPAVREHHLVHLADPLFQRPFGIEIALRILDERRQFAAQIPPRNQVIAFAAVGGIAVVRHGDGPVAFRQIKAGQNALTGPVGRLVKRQSRRVCAFFWKYEEGPLRIDRSLVIDQGQVVDAR